MRSGCGFFFFTFSGLLACTRLGEILFASPRWSISRDGIRLSPCGEGAHLARRCAASNAEPRISCSRPTSEKVWPSTARVVVHEATGARTARITSTNLTFPFWGQTMNAVDVTLCNLTPLSEIPAPCYPYSTKDHRLFVWLHVRRNSNWCVKKVSLVEFDHNTEVTTRLDQCPTSGMLRHMTDMSWMQWSRQNKPRISWRHHCSLTGRQYFRPLRSVKERNKCCSSWTHSITYAEQHLRGQNWDYFAHLPFSSFRFLLFRKCTRAQRDGRQEYKPDPPKTRPNTAQFDCHWITSLYSAIRWLQVNFTRWNSVGEFESRRIAEQQAYRII